MGFSQAYHGPICAGACVDARFQSFLDTMWNWNATHLTTGYYDGEIQLLSMVVASGNWWTPAVRGTTTSGGTTTTAPAPAPAPAPATSTGTANLVTNGDFASGTTSWSNWGNATVVNGAVNVGTGAGGLGQDIATKLTAGTKYLVTANASITAAAEGVFVGVKVTDSTGAVLLTQAQLVSSLTSTGVSIAFTAPANVAACNVYVWKNLNAAVGIVDNLALTAVA